MALSYDEVTDLPNGARFVRADLHIHSIHSYDVHDPTLTPEAIVQAAIEKNIEIIAVTDHHVIKGVSEAIDASARYGNRVFIIPGVELSTNDGHLLAYFDQSNLDNLARLMATLPMVNDDQGSRVQTSMLEAAKQVSILGGVSVPAHIDSETGFEVRMPGFHGAKRDLITSSAISGLEFLDPAHRSWYSADEPPGTPACDGRNRLAILRRQVPNIPAGGALACFCSSDAHEHAQIGRQLTRVKLFSLSFEAFRSAIADPEARIKIDSSLPPIISRIEGLHISGGFLDGTAIHFSQNLNVFFGGRGTGKSTAIKAIAFALGNPGYKMGDPPFQQVELYCESSTGAQYRFSRTAGGLPVGRMREHESTKPMPVDPSAFRVEYFSQGELEDVAKAALENPRSLQRFLDRHIDIEHLTSEEDALLRDAEAAASQLAPMITMFKRRDELDGALKELEERLKQSETKQLKNVAEIQNKVTAERSLRNMLDALSTAYKKGITLRNLLREPTEMRSLSRVAEFGKPTEAYFIQALQEVDLTNDFIVKQTRDTNDRLRQIAERLDSVISQIDSEHIRIDDLIQQRVSELKGKGLASSIAELNEMSTQKTRLVAELARIDSQRSSFDDATREYQERLEQLDSTRSTIKDSRAAQLRTLNRAFKSVDFPHDVLLITDESSVDLEEYVSFIDARMQRSGIHRTSIEALCSALTPNALANALDANNHAPLIGIPSIGQRWAIELSERLANPDTTLRLRLIWRPMAPRFKILDRHSHKEVPFDNLSGGQKHTILLTIALLSDSRDPLIIDQPEDDLDNKFIADSVVKTLRQIKELRQVILATHNANIAVLGDSELLIEMSHSKGAGLIRTRGSIDDANTKSAIKDTLEGGHFALQRRFEMYGMSP